MLNGSTLVDEYLNAYRIQIGLTSQDKLGFIISDDDEIIYQSDENLRNKSNTISFNRYYSVNMDNVEELELTDILNEEYLLNVQNKDDLFANLIIEDNGYTLEPYYFMMVELRNGGEFGLRLNKCLITNSKEDSFKISGNTIGVNMDIPDDEPLYLKDILAYYGILDENTLEYHFTEGEIRELVTNYLEEMKNNKTR